jgi:DNA repair protein RadC
VTLIDRHCATEIARQPRERLLSCGPTVLRDCELVSLILGSGTHNRPVASIAADVVSTLDEAAGVPSAGSLEAIAGLGPAKAAALCASFELARRVICPRRVRIRLPSDILPVVDRFVDRKQECFLTISLNGAHEVVATRIVTVGLVNRTMVHPREVFADPLSDRAAAIVLAHNHPSGCVEPSDEDREVTSRIVAAGGTLGIPVLDHVIFGRNGYFSFLEHDQL